MAFVVTETCIKWYMDGGGLPGRLPRRPEFLVMIEVHRLHAVRAGMPGGAIFSEEEIPDGQSFLRLNAGSPRSPVISEKKDAPADAKQWEGVPDKACC
jgi:ferredoxin